MPLFRRKVMKWRGKLAGGFLPERQILKSKYFCEVSTSRLLLLLLLLISWAFSKLCCWWVGAALTCGRGSKFRSCFSQQDPEKVRHDHHFFLKKNALPANWALQIGGRSVTTYVTKNYELYITRNLPFRWGSKTKIDKETTFSYFHSAHATEPRTFASESTHPRIELNWLSWWPSWQFLSWAAKRPETIIFRYTATAWHDTKHKQL